MKNISMQKKNDAQVRSGLPGTPTLHRPPLPPPPPPSSQEQSLKVNSFLRTSFCILNESLIFSFLAVQHRRVKSDQQQNQQQQQQQQVG